MLFTSLPPTHQSTLLGRCSFARVSLHPPGPSAVLTMLYSPSLSIHTAALMVWGPLSLSTFPALEHRFIDIVSSSSSSSSPPLPCYTTALHIGMRSLPHSHSAPRYLTARWIGLPFWSFLFCPVAPLHRHFGAPFLCPVHILCPLTSLLMEYGSCYNL